MVGWSRRNRERRKRYERFLKWYSTLSPEEQVEYDRRAEERWRRAKYEIALLLTLFVGMIVLWGWFLDHHREPSLPQGPPKGHHPMP